MDDDFEVFSLVRPDTTAKSRPPQASSKPKSNLQAQKSRPSSKKVKAPAKPAYPVSINRDMQNVLDANPEYIKHFTSDLMSYAVHPATLDLLVSKPEIDPLARNSMALRVACKMGILSSVEKLIDAGSDPAANNNEAIIWASENGYDDIVELLLQQYNVDPSVDSNRAYKLALKYKHTEVQKVLSRDARVSGQTHGTDADSEKAYQLIY